MMTVPIIEHRYPNYKEFDERTMALKVDEIASETQSFLNEFYNLLAERFFFIQKGKHRFEIKKEYISKAGFWLAKKRYAQWIVLKNGLEADKLEIKGLDVVRSSFPKAFQDFMRKMLKDILTGKSNDYIDQQFLKFKDELNAIPISKLAKGGSIKEISKYDDGTWEVGEKIALFKSGTPAHVKAGITYNRLLKFYKCAYKHEPIKDGDKIKWVYLKTNPLGLETLAFKNYNDPKEIMDFIELYIDRDDIYVAELENKIKDFYTALKWEKPSQEKINAKKFFAF